MEPAGGIQEHRVVPAVFGVGEGLLGDIHRVGLSHLKDGDAQLSAHYLQLLDGGGTVHVTGHQQGALVHPVFQIPGQLGAVGGLTRALEAHQHDDGGAGGGEGDLGVGPAHQGGKLLIDNLDNLLGGGQALQHVGTHRPLGDGGDELLDHLEADIGLQEGQAHLPHSLPHVGLGEPALAPQALKGGAQFFGQSFKGHRLSPHSFSAATASVILLTHRSMSLLSYWR